jgi:hypothetical protein
MLLGDADDLNDVVAEVADHLPQCEAGQLTAKVQGAARRRLGSERHGMVSL